MDPQTLVIGFTHLSPLSDEQRRQARSEVQESIDVIKNRMAQGYVIREIDTIAVADNDLGFVIRLILERPDPPTREVSNQ
jgi:hypothetical protein